MLGGKLCSLLPKIIFMKRKTSFKQKQREYSNCIPFAKDTFYLFMNSSSINWRKFTLQLASAIIGKIEPLTHEKHRNVLIVDDSLF